MFGWFTRRPVSFSDRDPLPGVNLGGWLVLEKWMTPSLFAGTSAIDEYTFCEQADPAMLDRLKRHRDDFITEADFKWLRASGVRAVRLPVGYWLFGDEPPYVGTVQYVDKAFKWAAKHQLKILLDLHGAPGSQNGKDHSGRAGTVDWHTDQSYVDKSLDVISRLSERYGRHPQLLGIELLNEPMPLMSKSKLLNFYDAAYTIIRATAGPDIWVVFHDGFWPRRWQYALPVTKYHNIYLDTHQYRIYTRRDKRGSIAWHLKRTLSTVPNMLARVRRGHPFIVGEWSLALDPSSRGKLSSAQSDALNRAYGAAQLLAYSQATAWFFWSYKTEGSLTWSFRESVDRGWLNLKIT